MRGQFQGQECLVQTALYCSFHVHYQRVQAVLAKQKFGPYVTDREHSTWFKILNREYSQKDGREELFERERHSEPVPGLAFLRCRMCGIGRSECLAVDHFTSSLNKLPWLIVARF